MEADPAARLVVAFVTLLRRSGVTVPLGSAVAFGEALGAVGLDERSHVYWAGRSTLLSRPEDAAVYDRVFAEFFDNQPAMGLETNRESVTIEVDGPDGEDEEADGETTQDEPTERHEVLRYSRAEILRRQDFTSYTEAEWEEARRLMAELRWHADKRRSRRLKSITSLGEQLDLARTVRSALSSDGEAVRRSWKTTLDKDRRTVFLIDISGSMEAYSRAFLRFAHALVVSRPLGAAEVFVLGTRMTRLTRQLASRDPDTAMAEAAVTVKDWFGGTRLGDGLRQFNDRWGVRGMARGATVVIFSDGWDRGDPEELAEQMSRLRRVTHRVVWVNPLRASPGYEPLARGMAAALPYVDDFVDGHSLNSLEELLEMLSDDLRRRPERLRGPHRPGPPEQEPQPAARS